MTVDIRCDVPALQGYSVVVRVTPFTQGLDGSGCGLFFVFLFLLLDGPFCFEIPCSLLPTGWGGSHIPAQFSRKWNISCQSQQKSRNPRLMETDLETGPLVSSEGGSAVRETPLLGAW